MPNLDRLLCDLECKLFADRSTLDDAFQYLNSAVNTLEPADRVLVLTAVHVLVNTIVKEVRALSVSEVAV